MKWNIEPLSGPTVVDAQRRMAILNGEHFNRELQSLRDRVINCERQMRSIVYSKKFDAASMPLSRIPLFPERVARFAVYGSNSSGKTTLLHSLLVQTRREEFLPSGPGLVTGRICSLKYAPANEARVTEISLANPSDRISHPLDPHSTLGPQLVAYLKRPTAESLSSWSMYTVEVQWPFSWLQSGMELVDLPGFTTDADFPEIKVSTEKYLLTTPLHGVIFSYFNPSFGDDSVAAMTELRRILSKRAKTMRSPASQIPIFMASTNFDLDSVGILSCPSLEEAVRKIDRAARERLSLLTTSAASNACANLGIIDPSQIGSSLANSPGFGVVGALGILDNQLDYPSLPDNRMSWEWTCNRIIHSTFVHSLTRWMASTKSTAMANYISSLIAESASFHNRVSAIETSAATISSQKDEALGFLASYNNAIASFINEITADTTLARTPSDSSSTSVSSSSSSGSSASSSSSSLSSPPRQPILPADQASSDAAQITPPVIPNIMASIRSILLSPNLTSAAFSKFDSVVLDEHARSLSIVALQPDVLGAVSRLATRYRLPIPPILDNTRIFHQEIVCELSKFVSHHVFGEVMRLGCASWTKTFVTIISSTFMFATKKRRLVDLVVARLVDIRGVGKLLRSTDADVATSSLPLALSGFGSQEFAAVLERTIGEYIQIGLAQYWQTTSSDNPPSSISALLTQCLEACKHIIWDHLEIRARLRTAMDGTYKKFCAAVLSEIVEINLWAGRIQDFRHTLLPQYHAISITQCWNSFDFVSEIGEFCPLESLHHTFTNQAQNQPPTAQLIAPPPPGPSNLLIPEPTVILTQRSLKICEVISQPVDLEYLETVYNMVKLYEAGGLQHMLFPIYIAISNENGAIWAHHYYLASETCSSFGQFPRISRHEFPQALLSALDTIQFCFKSGIAKLSLAPSDVNVWGRASPHPRFLVGRAGAWSLLHGNRLVPSSLLHSAPLAAFSFFFRNLCTYVGVDPNSNQTCRAVTALLQDPMATTNPDGILTQIKTDLSYRLSHLWAATEASASAQ